MVSESEPRGRTHTLLITGATGFIGSRLAALAIARGLDVRTLTRSDWTGRPAVPAAQRYFGSLPSGIPQECLAGVDAVVHCAAQTGAGSESTASAVNVEGTLRLARAAVAAGVRRFLFFSSQSARSDARSAYGRTKFEAEEALRATPELDVVVLRPGLVCGDGARGLYQRISEMVRRFPVVPLLGGGRALVQPIHVDDLCEAVFRVLAVGSPGRRVLHLGDPRGVTLEEFVQAISLASTRKRKATVNVPLWPVELAVRAAESIGIRLPITRDNLQGLRAVERMETVGDLDSLGLSLRPLAAAVAPAAAIESADDEPLSPEEARATYVIIPAYNEEKVIRATVARVARLGVHVVVVDDCSLDGTAAELRDLPVTVLQHAVNLGQGAALQTGIDFALGHGARYLVTFDSDGQHDEADIPRFVHALIQRDLEIVLGSRFLGRAVGMGLRRRLLLKAALLYTRMSTRLDLTDVHNGLRAFRAEAAPALRITQDRMAHASEILENIRRGGLRYAEMPNVVRYSAYSKAKGQSNLGAIDILFELFLRRWLR